MNAFNPSDLASDNLDARNTDWEEYAEFLDQEALEAGYPVGGFEFSDEDLAKLDADYLGFGDGF